MTTERAAVVAPAMGAMVTDDGVAFRVWAPHATSVHVVGDFNQWNPAASPLAVESNGHWHGVVPGAAAGQEYRFAITTASGVVSKIDPYARQVTNSVGNAVIYDHAAFDWEGVEALIAPHHQLVIYELHVGSFYAGDSDRPGTFELVAERFDHLVKLGVNAIQIMPVAEFAGDYSWGYNPAHIFAVESSYGGPNALKTLIKEAHRRGIAVILDVVYNHFGPSDLDLWQFDGWSENGKGGIYFYNDHRSHTPWGDTRPDYGRQDVRNYIHDNAMSWLRDYRVDGLRYDMTPYIRSVNGVGIDLPDGWSMMRWINQSIREEFPGRITIAEDMQQDPRISSTEKDGAAFNAQWDGAFVHPVREAVIGSDDAARSVDSLAGAVSQIYNGDAFQRVIYTESHDEVANGRARVPHEVNPDDPTGWHAQKRSTIGAALVLTSPGIPMLFQGQEFLQGMWFRDDVPLDWDQSTDFRGIVRMYRDLINLRRNGSGRSAGLTGQHIDVYHANEEDNVLVFHRWADHGVGDDVVVIVNLHHEPRQDYQVGMPFAGRWQLLFNSDAIDYSSDFEGFDSFDTQAEPTPCDGLEHSALVNIAAYTVLIYSRAE